MPHGRWPMIDRFVGQSGPAAFVEEFATADLASSIRGGGQSPHWSDILLRVTSNCQHNDALAHLTSRPAKGDRAWTASPFRKKSNYGHEHSAPAGLPFLKVIR